MAEAPGTEAEAAVDLADVRRYRSAGALPVAYAEAGCGEHYAWAVEEAGAGSRADELGAAALETAAAALEAVPAARQMVQ